MSGYDVEHIEPPKNLQNCTGAAFLFAIETAMRAGEIASLTWNNINFEKHTAFLPITKNGHSRTVPLSVKAIEILQHLTSVKTESDPRVFQMEARQLDHNFRKLKKMAGLENANLHFHDTCREALTRLAEKVDVMVLAKISGHRDLSILQNTYYAPDMAEIAQRL
ncbi:site-specific integrase [Haemophilus influenzae]|nr:site-specific integrase [Haemophilus influenzae]MCK8802083.1 site-specific integrase [Haemophilus influenzae]MCK8885563.1 site-specific integrase [Haemophilus influenzae]MCK9053902.1 site-specific integrase [Haemophilus influenzae]MCK9145639.1 site-specific integrase [Haemophilus influenzae]